MKWQVSYKKMCWNTLLVPLAFYGCVRLYQDYAPNESRMDNAVMALAMSESPSEPDKVTVPSKGVVLDLRDNISWWEMRVLIKLSTLPRETAKLYFRPDGPSVIEVRDLEGETYLIYPENFLFYRVEPEPPPAPTATLVALAP